MHKTANKYGLFSDTGYNCLGDKYNDKDVLSSSRTQGQGGGVVLEVIQPPSSPTLTVISTPPRVCTEE